MPMKMFLVSVAPSKFKPWPQFGCACAINLTPGRGQWSPTGWRAVGQSVWYIQHFGHHCSFCIVFCSTLWGGPKIEGGRVYLPQTADWLDSFIDETVQFPSANHDDQVDAMTIALDTLSRTHVGSEAWELQGSMSSLNNVSRETLGKSLLDTATKIKSKWTGWGLPSN